MPMFALAILRTRALPRWIGWLGLVVGVLAGWLGLLGPASGVIEGISSIGFIGFFVFMLSMGSPSCVGTTFGSPSTFSESASIRGCRAGTTSGGSADHSELADSP